MFSLAIFKDIESSHLSTYRGHWISEAPPGLKNNDHLSWRSSELKIIWVENHLSWRSELNYYLILHLLTTLRLYFPFPYLISTTFIFLFLFPPNSTSLCPLFPLLSSLLASSCNISRLYRRGWHRGPDSLRLKVLFQSATVTISRRFLP